MSSSTACDIAIIGAGIAGASLAWHLAQRGVAAGEVLLIERESQPGYHSTGRSAAMFMESYGSPMARALTRASRAFYTAPPDGFAQAPIVSPRGALYVAASHELDDIQALQDTLRSTGTEVNRLGAAEVLALAPCLRPESAAAGLWEEAAMDLDVHTLHGGFLRGARRAGVPLLTNHGLVAVRAVSAGFELVFEQGARIQARRVVNAAGAWADHVAVLCGARPLGLQPCRRSALRFAAPTQWAVSGWPAVAAVDESWYFKPDAGQLLASPANADPVPAQDVQPEELDIALAIHRIEQATTLRVGRPTATWAGLRTFSPDGELVIGWDAQIEGLFWLAAQGGYGIQSAAGAGRLAQQLVDAQPLSADLQAEGVRPAALSPARPMTPA